MKMKTDRKRIFVNAVILVMMICGLSGCGAREDLSSPSSLVSQEQSPVSQEQPSILPEESSASLERAEEDFRAVVDHFSTLYLAFDEDGWLFDQALDAVNAYLEGNLEQEKAAAELEKTIHTYEEEMDGLPEFTVADDFLVQLNACGISAEEYKAFGNSRKNDIYHYFVSLSTLLEFLQNSEEMQESYEDLQFFYSVNSAEQDSMRGYYYYGCLNYWFVGASTAEKDYLQEQVIRKIKAYLPEDPTWYDDQEKVEEKVMLYLDEVEEMNGQVARHVGTAQEELYQAKQDYEELQDKIEEKQLLEEKLARLREISTRIEEINEEAKAAKEAGDQEGLSALKEEFEAIVAEYEMLTAEDKEED